MKVKDVEAKHISGFGNLFTRDKFKDNVELPCLEACLYLYDLNIRTMSTNCNKEEPNVYIMIDFGSLSDENKEIARNLANEGKLFLNEEDNEHLNCGIKFSASLEDDVDEISNKLLKIVKYFQIQDVLSKKFKMTKINFLNRTLRNEEVVAPGFKFEIDDDGEISLCYYGDRLWFSEIELDIMKNIVNHCYELYDEMIEKNMVDLETGDVFENEELAKKHQDYLEKNKGKKR